MRPGFTAGASVPLGQAIGFFAVGAYGLIVVAATLLPETAGQSPRSEALA